MHLKCLSYNEQQHRTEQMLCPRALHTTIHLIQLRGDVGELTLFELGLPEDGVGVHEADLLPACNNVVSNACIHSYKPATQIDLPASLTM